MKIIFFILTYGPFLDIIGYLNIRYESNQHKRCPFGIKKYLSENKRSASTIVAYGKDIEQLINFLDELSKKQIHGSNQRRLGNHS